MIEEDTDWSPDEDVAFTRYGIDVPHDKATSSEIFLINPNGRGKPRRLTNNDDEELGPARSPDGKQLAFMCRAGGTAFQACVMNVDGSGLRDVTSGRSVSWSPDGKTLIFHRTVEHDDTEDEQLFSVDLSGSNEQQLTSGGWSNGWANPGLLRTQSPYRE
ncbi:hypothetical protein BH24ACI3_BH24ACI3_04830 [soil metagenome]